LGDSNSFNQQGFAPAVRFTHEFREDFRAQHTHEAFVRENLSYELQGDQIAEVRGFDYGRT